MRWDDDVKVIKARRKWLRKARRVPTLENKIEFKKARSKYLPKDFRFHGGTMRWDDDVKKVIKARRKWLRKARRVPTLENKIEFKKARAIARKTFKEKRSNSWNNFVSSIDQSTSSGELFHKINKLRGKYSPRF
jgi:hypothetical protein